MLDLLRQDAKIGDSLNLYLTTGDSVRDSVLISKQKGRKIEHFNN